MSGISWDLIGFHMMIFFLFVKNSGIEHDGCEILNKWAYVICLQKPANYMWVLQHAMFDFQRGIRIPGVSLCQLKHMFWAQDSSGFDTCTPNRPTHFSHVRIFTVSVGSPLVLDLPLSRLLSSNVSGSEGGGVWQNPHCVGSVSCEKPQ